MVSDLTSMAKSLRKESTDAERFLWKHLRSKQIEGFKFRRQEPIGKCIVDFSCYEKKVIVEVDGGQHSEEKDAERDKRLQSQGFNVLRFWNHQVLSNIEGVLEIIWRTCTDSIIKPPSPNPSHRGRGDKRTCA